MTKRCRQILSNIHPYKKLIVSAVMASSVLITPVFAAETTQLNYDDFKPNEYWSDDMIWATEQGLIKGYIDARHPITDKKGNWLNPYGDLTEAQMLSVLFQYFAKEELAASGSTPGFWALAQYQLADEYDVMTRGISSSNDTMTRGEVAMALATIHFGRKVDLETAIQFMYDSGLSTGYTDKNGEKPKTFASYGATDPVRRAHIATFLHKYDLYVKETTVKSETTDTSSMHMETIDQIVQLVNQERSTRGLRPLQLYSGLQLVAEMKAKDMADNNYFDHESPTYGFFSDLLLEASVDYDKAGENLAYGYPDAEAVVKGWMASEGHRKNILDPTFTHIGVGVYEDDQDKRYYAQVFIDER
ncbi:CAP domain-containing protein [Aquibacillus salsiterrae]|uniref:CAP domain-containing protein n=1 Tax=Aquibacillus salsiterrae TaxID=2950439 RepID=A0A9X4AFD9_9BACI|nr:CAP domain-containing protein [Aquibacillus salsiterrae]MDC3415943.1 CAP domain-containing protein [Aquibacillus salsiterrae]